VRGGAYLKGIQTIRKTAMTEHDTSQVNLLEYRESDTSTRVRFEAKNYFNQVEALDEIITYANSIFSHWEVDWTRQSARVIYETQSSSDNNNYLIEITITENK
jgi:hypothetical protein